MKLHYIIRKDILSLGLLIIAGILNGLFAQTITPRQTGTLPAVLQESSGLEEGPNRTLWSHNDSGNDPILYQIDSTGKILREVFLRNASNNDWEDIAQDDAGNIFVADIGNNGNWRRDLRIYRVDGAEILNQDTVEVDTISFRYAEQVIFPTPANELHYDAEALLWANGSLHLFSKNRTAPFDGWIYHYKISDQPGDYVIQRVDSFQTRGNQKETYWATAADVSEDGSRMVVLSSDKMWVFACYKDDDFFKGFGLPVSLGTISQKEAITFVGARHLMLSDERFIITGGKIYELDIQGLPAIKVNLGTDRMLAGDSVILKPLMPADTRFQWSTGDTSTSLIVRQPGTYFVEIDLNGCIAHDTVEVLGPSSLVGDEALPEIEIGPNPFAQTTQISVSLPVPGPVEISLLDSAGKVAYKERKVFTSGGEQQFEFQPKGLAPGHYQLVLRQNSYRVSGRVIVE